MFDQITYNVIIIMSMSIAVNAANFLIYSIFTNNLKIYKKMTINCHFFVEIKKKQRFIDN